jgi:hypothetical protein
MPAENPIDLLVIQTKVEPRPYQTRIINKTANMFLGTYRNGAGEFEPPAQSVMIESPTGSGEICNGSKQPESQPGIGDEGVTGNPVITAFHEMTGDVSRIYGLANVDGLLVKRQRTLPVSCRVCDLLNFVSEVATHHADEQGARASQAWLGTLVSHEYDLEDSCDTFDDFQDFFLDRKLDGETAMDLQKVSV